MILLDTNVVIYASVAASPYHTWARETIAAAVSGPGAMFDAVSLAEVCVGAADPATVGRRLGNWGITLVDSPVVAAAPAAAAYRLYRSRAGKATPALPLPDFFIGAHAEVMGWEIATADQGRFRTYFPDVRLITP